MYLTFELLFSFCCVAHLGSTNSIHLFYLTLHPPLHVERGRNFKSLINILFYHIIFTSLLCIYHPIRLYSTALNMQGLCVDGLLLQEKVGMRFKQPLPPPLLLVQSLYYLQLSYSIILQLKQPGPPQTLRRLNKEMLLSKT